MAVTDFPALIAKLEAWTPEAADFHRDRQLSDEILIADGWTCERDPAFAGGVRWSRRMGIGTYCSDEASRPHPINDVNTAIGLLPLRSEWSIAKTKEGAVVVVAITPNRAVIGRAKEIAVAICIAAVRALHVMSKAELSAREARQ